MGLMLEGKVIRRLPSTGGKVIKMITYMEMGDTLDTWRDGRARGGYDTVAGGNST